MSSLFTIEQPDHELLFQTDSDQSTVTTLESVEEKQLGDSSIANQLHYHQHTAETGSQPHAAGCFSDNVDIEEVEVDEEEDLDIILHGIPAENIIETSTASTSQHDNNYVQEKEGGKTLTAKMLTGLFGFTLYHPPPPLCRHPAPATGKDDGVMKLQGILDDLLVKSGNTNRKEEKNKILFAPDNKIGKISSNL